ncbi:hypothetical protein SRHO_G00038860 [Serrasalmus rhombeus]
MKSRNQNIHTEIQKSVIMKRGGNPTKKSFLPELRNISECPSNPLAVNPTSGNTLETLENSSSKKRTEVMKTYSWLCEKAGVEGEVFYQDLEGLTPVPQPAPFSPSLKLA